MSSWENVAPKNSGLGKGLVGKLSFWSGTNLVGKMSDWENVSWENVWLRKCGMGKCLVENFSFCIGNWEKAFGKLSFGKMSLGKCRLRNRRVEMSSVGKLSEHEEKNPKFVHVQQFPGELSSMKERYPHFSL